VKLGSIAISLYLFQRFAKLPKILSLVGIALSYTPCRKLVGVQGVKALHVVPIFVESQFWGIVGFDDCREAKHRSSSELAILKTAAACIGSEILLTTYDGDEDIYRGLRAGAKSYLLKDASTQEILSAIRQVCTGKNHIPPAVGARLAERAQMPDLTDREREVLQQMATGQSNQEIGLTLRIAESTVKTHVNSILSKLGVGDRTQAAIVAFKRGIAKL